MHNPLSNQRPQKFQIQIPKIIFNKSDFSHMGPKYKTLLLNSLLQSHLQTYSPSLHTLLSPTVTSLLISNLYNLRNLSLSTMPISIQLYAQKIGLYPLPTFSTKESQKLKPKIYISLPTLTTSPHLQPLNLLLMLYFSFKSYHYKSFL